MSDMNRDMRAHNADNLALSLGLRAIADGSGWRLVSPTGVPLFYVTRRGLVGGGVSWRITSVVDLCGVGAG